MPMTKPTSEQVTFLAAGSGASQRTVLDKLRDVVSVKDFGVVGDNATDDSPALSAAVAACAASGKALWCPAGMTVYLASAVDMRGVSVICFESAIRVNSAIASIPITVGGFATGTVCSWKFRDVTDGTSVFTVPARPVFRIFGVKRSELTIGGCNWIQMWADSAVASGSSNAYNDVYLNGAQGRLTITDSGAALSWNNENCFWGGGIKELEIVGVSYKHNHNKFYNNVLESPIAITITNAEENYIYGARFEQTSTETVTFSSDSMNNAVFRTWSGAGYVGAKFLDGVLVADAGEGNVVSTEACISHKPTCIFSVSPQSLIVGTATDAGCSDYRIARPGPYLNPTTKNQLIPGLADVVAVNANRFIALSDYIPVQLGDVFGFSADFTGNQIRPIVFVFDLNMKPLTSESGGGVFVNIPGVSAISTSGGYGYYSPGTNLAADALTKLTTASVNRSDVYYVRVGLFSSNANVRFRELSAFLWSKPSKRFSTAHTAQRLIGPTIVNGTPTSGWLPVGYQVLDSSSSPATHRFVSLAYETTLSAGAATGATSLTVTAISTIANGDIVGVLLDDGTTHWSVVSALAGSTFTVSALPSDAAAGNRIAFNRWTT